MNREKRVLNREWKEKIGLKKRGLLKIVALTTICLFLVVQSEIAFSQNRKKSGNEIVVDIEELVIESERVSPFRPLVRVVAVIEKMEIERAAVQNLQDLLRYIQGADLRSRGSEGVQADLNILGGTFDQTMVMINGINFTDPQTGHHSLNIPVEISQIERIELLHGPGAWSDGAIAYSGAINIITSNPTKNSLRATLSGGDYRYFNGNLNAQFITRKDSLSWRVSGQTGGGYSQSDGYAYNTDFSALNLYSNIALENRRGHTINIQAGIQEKAFGANSFLSQVV